MAQVPSTINSSDFQTGSILDASITNATANFEITHNLAIPTTNGMLTLGYASTQALGATNGPETIQYATYTAATGAITGAVRGCQGTTAVAHDSAEGKTVQAGMTTALLTGCLDKQEITSDFTTTNTTMTDIPNLASTVTVPAGRRIKVTLFALGVTNTAATSIDVVIREGSTSLQTARIPISASGVTSHVACIWVGTPSTGAHTYKVSTSKADAGTTTMYAGATYPAQITVELI